MKKLKMVVFGGFVFTALLFLLVGCGKSDDFANFNSSESLDADGLWDGVKALDYVEMFDYQALNIPADVHQVSDYDIQNTLNEEILPDYITLNYVTDRAVNDGDTVNIDFIGSIDGVEFDGGSTDGMGAEVIIGVTNYIDDFLEQLIGHSPGDAINVEVTFPDDYHEQSLQGQDAVFVTIINFIVDKKTPELTDEFVSENLSAVYGWITVDEMMEDIRSTHQKNAVNQYINEYLKTNVIIKSIPEQIIKYQEKAMINYYQEEADYYDMELDELLSLYGLPDSDNLIASYREEITKEATYSLVLQAIAEDVGISVGSQDLAEYFMEYYGTSDYTSFEEQYGLPWLKQFVRNQKVLDYIIEKAVFE